MTKIFVLILVHLMNYCYSMEGLRLNIISYFQVFLYDISIDDDRDPLERVLFKFPPDLGEDMVSFSFFYFILY